MAVPYTNPLPAPSFQTPLSSQVTPADLLRYLRSLLVKETVKNREEWGLLVSGLSQHFLESFPPRNFGSWDALHEKAQLAQVSLEVIEHATTHVEGVLIEEEEQVLVLLIRFMRFLAAVESWSSTSHSDSQDNAPDSLIPEQLCKNAVESFTAVLKSLVVKAPSMDCRTFSPTNTLYSVLHKCLSTVRDVVALGPVLPLKIGLINKVWSVKPLSNDDPFDCGEGGMGAEISSPLELNDQRNVWSSLSYFLIIPIKALVAMNHGHLWLSGDIIAYATRSLRVYSDALLSSTCAISQFHQAKCSKVLIQSYQLLHPMAGNSSHGLQCIITSFLLWRLRVGPGPEWETADVLLHGALGNASLEPEATVCSIVDILAHEKWGASAEMLRTCAVAAVICTLQPLRREAVEQLCPDLFKDQSTSASLLKIQSSLLKDTTERPSSSAVNEQASLPQTVFVSLRQCSFFADSERELDEVTEDSLWACKILDIIHSKLISNDNLSIEPETRETILTSIKILLPVLLTKAAEPSQRAAQSLPMVVTVLQRLLAGSPDQISATLHRNIFGIITDLLREFGAIFTRALLNSTQVNIEYGSKARDRGVRLASGRCHIELIRISQQLKKGAALRLEKSFTIFDDILQNSPDMVKETTLVTLGILGRTNDIIVLGRVLLCLITQLGQNSALLKGLAYIQLVSLTKCHKKGPYSMLLPYFPQVSIFVVSHIAAQPNLLLEICRFLTLAQSDFLTLALPHSLPHLFSSCNIEALEKLEQELGKKISWMFINASPEILSHAYMLRGEAQSSTALDFIVRILTSATNKGEITLGNVVRSCTVHLLAHLVIAMGEGIAERAETARRAISRVEKAIVAEGTTRVTRSQQNMGSFLQIYVLGILVHLNEVLQDVQRKKSIEAKRQVLRGLGCLIQQIGPAIANVSPQIIATLNATLSDDGLSDVTLVTWHTFMTTLNIVDVSSHLGCTSAAFVDSWHRLSKEAQETVKQILDYLVLENAENLQEHIDDIVDLSFIPELEPYARKINLLRPQTSQQEKLQLILARLSSDHATVIRQSLVELRRFMLQSNSDFIRDITSGDTFDPLVGQIVQALIKAACREGEHDDALRLLAFDCLGVLGAADPDRFEMYVPEARMIVLSNFADEQEAYSFALHLIQDVLVGAFRSANDLKFQNHLAFAMQELLKFCQFTPDLVLHGLTSSIPIKVRNRWASLPEGVLETVTPLLGAKYSLSENAPQVHEHPIYPTQATYREWLQSWTSHLITRVSGQRAKDIFEVFRAAVRNKDVGVAHHILPHLVLNVLVSGKDEDVQQVRMEIITVLEDRINTGSQFSPDKRLLSAQAIFMLMDHLNKWIRIARQDLNTKKQESKRSRQASLLTDVEEQLSRVDSILGSIDQDLTAKAALECKAYARSLMNFEKRIVELRMRPNRQEDLQTYFDKLHEIYCHLDEPDGMEGVSMQIMAPSLEHQIRQHESTGKWTSAQSCWEVRLQQSPDNMDYHRGLLRCLRNLGHYDTLRTHIRGLLTRNPDWEQALAGFQVEAAWMVKDWDAVQRIVMQNETQTPELVIARILLAMHFSSDDDLRRDLTWARGLLGAPVTAAGPNGYRRAYDAILNLHLLQDIERIFFSVRGVALSQPDTALSPVLNSRLNATLPTFRTREPILSMHRVAFSISAGPLYLSRAIGNAWVSTAKIARKAGHWQTAYSAVLQAQESRVPFAHLQSSKLTKATGEPLRALHELEHVLDSIQSQPSRRVDTQEDLKSFNAKASLLRVRWMRESERFDAGTVLKEFSNLSRSLSASESAHFHHGHFQDECYKNLSTTDKKTRGSRMNLNTVKAYTTAIRLGSKYTYEMIPRLLTLWLDMGEDSVLCQGDIFRSVNDELKKAVNLTPVYKWLTAFPQVVSRVDHKNPEAFTVLSRLIVTVLQEYPQQGLWLFMSVVKSTKHMREQRGKDILGQLRNNPRLASTQVPQLVAECLAMSTELLKLCDHPIKDDNVRVLKMSRDFPTLSKLAPSQLIIPLQESLTVALPVASSAENIHQPFPLGAPTFQRFTDEIEVMRSLAKPRKLTIMGSNGQTYMFLGKPKDDLRKDARLMDFNSIINKLLKTNSESRRRQLRIRTYSVVTLNEECGFIQWVPNTVPVRPILVRYYTARGIESWNREMNTVFNKIKDATDKDGSKIFEEKILPLFPPLFHEWFIETFPEPSAWLASRLAYGRTAAVMSMVGFILGLGDRHLENILLDINTGDVVHVDFNCLFEKGKTLETPERVPFRLTQNMVDGFGVTGVEGVFRIASEITMQLLRDNKDILMSVLDAFIHDPLVEWEDEKRKKERQTKGDRNSVKQSVDLRQLARDALNPIEKKLKGLYSKDSNRNDKRNKEVTTSNLVQMLIEEATDLRNLSKMYPGWAPWH